MQKNSLKKFLAGAFALLVTAAAWADTIWIDVRSDEEYQQSHIEGDLHIPYQSIATAIEQYSIDKDTEIYLYCQAGGRAGKAKKSLEASGYTRVINAGGISEVRRQRNLKE